MVITKKISLETKGECDIIDITPHVEQQVAETGINNGTVTVFVSGSTAGIATIEHEPGVISDFQNMWGRLVPKNIPYQHDRRWGDGNGFSHIRAAVLGASMVVPFNNQKLILGTWQQLILVDFDNRPRSRQIILQIMGE
ncbi:secondary thiamine-phosphate synthase enzyme YjbQ [Chloroflexota bacterium]